MQANQHRCSSGTTTLSICNWLVRLQLVKHLNFRKTPVKGILKSRPVTPEVIVDNVNIVERSKEVADKALNLLNPYRQIFSKQLKTVYFCSGSRKYVQRQKSLKKAFSWWEDEDENPDIAYKDFSRRKLLFDFGAHRRNSDVSIRTFKMDQVN